MLAPRTTLPKALVCHPWMGLAGSEMVTAWLLEALKEDYELHVCTAGGFNPEQWDAASGTQLSHANLYWIEAQRLPGVKCRTKLPHLHRAVFEQFCRRISPGYDLLISGYNPIAFGRPAIHVLGDIRWQQQFTDNSAEWRAHHQGASWKRYAQDFYRRTVNRLFHRQLRHQFQPQDLFLSNSQWTLRQYREWMPQVRHGILYPPVPVKEVPDADSFHKPAEPVPHFILLGRISPEKKVAEAIAILDQVRERGHELKLQLVGEITQSSYGERIRQMIASRPWVSLLGPKYGAEKEALLQATPFGIHACDGEAFGIAVAEMVHQGCLTWVPASSGAAEIVTDPMFRYQHQEEAATKISQSLTQSPEQLQAQRQLGRRHVQESFLPRQFVSTFREHVAQFILTNSQQAPLPPQVVVP